VVILLALLAAISLPPKPDRYVTDHAGVLRDANALNEKLAQFERTTSDQILVYVDRHLPPDTTIEEMGSEAMKQWRVGQKGKDNGAILFVFVDDHKMRIEVGYGLEASLTDAKSKRIIETVIKPDFKRGDFTAGVDHGVDAIIATIRGEPYAGSGRTVAETPVHTIPFAVCPIALFLLIAFVVWAVYAQAKQNKRRTGSAWAPFITTSDSSSSSSWSSSSSDSSSSSFDGGGGSGGGGGASGSW
jgi:uncharacterized protein